MHRMTKYGDIVRRVLGLRLHAHRRPLARLGALALFALFDRASVAALAPGRRVRGTA